MWRTILPVLCCLAAAQLALAESTLKCSSDDGKRHYCKTDIRGGVRLSRQISGSPCTQGSTWDFDNRGIWVDRGCRAEFTVGSNSIFGGNPGGNPSTNSGGNFGNQNSFGAGQTIRCASDDGHRHTCRADTRGGVRLLNQISGSPCEQGRTWGYDANAIWVDRGCRADFTVGGSSQSTNNSDYRNGGTQVVQCSSDDGKRHYCRADTSRGVSLSRQISGSACNVGQTWDFDSRGIWVDRGCRAEFQLGAR